MDSISSPTECSKVRVIQGVLQLSCGPECVGFRNAGVQCWVLEVGIEIVGAGLSDGIWWVANNDVDGGLFLAFDALVVVGEYLEIEDVAFFVDLEGGPEPRKVDTGI